MIAIDGANLHRSNAIKQFSNALVTLRNGTAKFVTVYIKVIKKPNKSFFKESPLGRFFNMMKNSFQCLIQIGIIGGIGADIHKKFAGQNKKTFFLNQSGTCFLSLFIR